MESGSTSRIACHTFCFRVGKVAVSVGFAANGVTFEQRMEHYLQTL